MPFPLEWKLGESDRVLQVSKTAFLSIFGMNRTVLKEQEGSPDNLALLVSHTERIDGVTWLGRTVAREVNHKFFQYITREHSLELLRLLTEIEEADLVGYSEKDLSYVINPSNNDIIQHGIINKIK